MYFLAANLAWAMANCFPTCSVMPSTLEKGTWALSFRGFSGAPYLCLLDSHDDRFSNRYLIGV